MFNKCQGRQNVRHFFQAKCSQYMHSLDIPPRKRKLAHWREKKLERSTLVESLVIGTWETYSSHRAAHQQIATHRLNLQIFYSFWLILFAFALRLVTCHHLSMYHFIANIQDHSLDFKEYSTCITKIFIRKNLIQCVVNRYYSSLLIGKYEKAKIQKCRGKQMAQTSVKMFNTSKCLYLLVKPNIIRSQTISYQIIIFASENSMNRHKIPHPIRYHMPTDSTSSL